MVLGLSTRLIRLSIIFRCSVSNLHINNTTNYETKIYQGRLQDGKEIAVKRLSIHSGQGNAEFKTEVLLMTKLQHKNLVKLFGFSIKESERLLIYEFILNTSLDRFLFGILYIVSPFNDFALVLINFSVSVPLLC